MHLNPYGEDAVALAVDLANTPPLTLDELVERCHSAGVVINTLVAEADMMSVRSVIDRWREVAQTRDEEERAALLNRLSADAAITQPYLTDHAGTGWHLHYRRDGLRLPELLHALICVGTALHLAGRGMARLGQCALPECTNIFADTSRTGRQRYCSTRCSNRHAVRRHRTRRASSPQA
jgi:predicted RNA-binding Zn ribbon-like protein